MAEDESIDVNWLMTPEMIIGALVWAVSRGELNQDIWKLARSLPQQSYNHLGGSWDMVGKFVHASSELNERSLQHVQEMLAVEIRGLVAWAKRGRPKTEAERDPHNLPVSLLVIQSNEGRLTQETLDQARQAPQKYFESIGSGFGKVGEAVRGGADLETVQALVEEWLDDELVEKDPPPTNPQK